MATLKPLPLHADLADGEVYADLEHLEVMLDFDARAKELKREPLPFMPQSILPFLDIPAMQSAWAMQDYYLIRRSYARAFVAQKEEGMGFACALTPDEFMGLYEETAS
jgi:uncharacterized protein with von Willebrand factor type A (vWA) domain